jgi:hypothetical protein
VSWNAVIYAASYVVDVDGVEVPVTETTYSVVDYGTYVIKVKAISGDAEVYLDSDYSNVVTLNYEDPRSPLEAPIIDKEDYQTIYWLPVDNAISYQVYVDSESYGNPTTGFDFSIEDFDYGTFTLTVSALPEDSVTYKESPVSNEIVLELIDPATYKDRLELEIIGNRNVFLGDSFAYAANLSDTLGGDISNIDDEVVWSIVSGSAATIDASSGQLTTLEVGSVTIEAVLDLENEVVATQQVTILDRPTITVTIASYDKVTPANNIMSVTSAYDGTLYYAWLDEEPASYSDVISAVDAHQAAIVAGNQDILMDLGAPRGEDINVYFVLVCTLNEEVVGNSHIYDLLNLPLNAVRTHVTTATELQAALSANDEYIVLDNDIRVGGAWTRIETIFTGTLDGNHHKLYELTLSGGGTGIFKKLGNHAVIKNMTIADVTATGFSGAKNTILSSDLEKDARVIIRNVAFENTYMNAAIDGSSRSTAACLFGEYNYASDSSLELIIDNTYIDYRLDITRATQTWNIGAIFGTFVSASSKALTMTNVFVDIYVTGNFGNAGGLIGQGSGVVSLTNVVVHAEKENGSNIGSNFYLDIGSKRSDTTLVWTEDNVIYLSYTCTNANFGSVIVSDVNQITALSVADLISDSEGVFSFDTEDNVLSILVNGSSHEVEKAPESKLATPILEKNEYVVTWATVLGARGYLVTIDGGDPVAMATRIYDFAAFAVGDHTIQVVAVGNGYDIVNSDPSELMTVTIEPIVLDPLPQTTITLDGTTALWTAVAGAVGYQVYVNDAASGGVITNLSIDLSSYAYGEYHIQVIAVADNITNINSYLSNEVIFANKFEVTTATELRDAINANVGYIDIANDINLAAYTTASTLTFTGIIDGNNHVLSDLAFTSANSALIRTIGNGAIVRNLSFMDCTITAGGGNIAILASTVAANAKVKVINVAFVNIVAQTLFSNSSSTQGGVFGNYKDATDNNINITLDHVYVDYTHNVVRTEKAQSNIGAIFGTFQAGTNEALTIKNSYIKFNVSGWWSNAGALVGNNMPVTNIKNTVIEANYTNKHASSSSVKFDSGNTTNVVTSSGVILMTESDVSTRATLADSLLRSTTTLTIDDLLTLTLDEMSLWMVEEVAQTATITIAGSAYEIGVIAS